MITIWNYLLGWLPSPIALVFAGLTVLLIIFITVRIVKIILDTLPFV